jgi:adenosine deaminase
VVWFVANHPLKKRLRLGLRATINSDDPAYFGGYVGANGNETALSLSRSKLIALARNSFLGSFLPRPGSKHTWPRSTP